MKFGTIFRNRANLEETLNREYPWIEETLDRIRYKKEWCVKVYLTNRGKFEAAVIKENKKIKEIEKELASLTEGMAFFMEEELKEVISGECDIELNTIAGVLLERLGRHASAFVRCRTLEKEVTGRSGFMLLNVAYLIPDEKEENFIKDAEMMNQEILTKGFYLEYSGPWPAFNFTS